MPIQRCTLPDGGSGYKWGDNGKCYADRSKAIEQMRAIKYQQSKGTVLELAMIEEEIKKEIKRLDKD